MSVDEFDRRFDAGESIFELGMRAEDVEHPGWKTQRVNLDLPLRFLERLDRAATERGIARQALIKHWLFERLEATHPVTEKAHLVELQAEIGLLRDRLNEAQSRAQLIGDLEEKARVG